MSEFGKQNRRINMAIKALEDMGGTYDLQDVVEGINKGDFQSFVNGSSWAVTQVLDFPRKRVLHLFLLVGELNELQELEHRIEDFAVVMKADFISAWGRDGWHKFAAKSGWKHTRSMFVKEMS